MVYPVESEATSFIFSYSGYIYPPVQPMSISVVFFPCLNLIGFHLLVNLLFKPIAPVIPVSSSIVNKASIVGCGMSLLSKMAIIVATPKPLSAFLVWFLWHENPVAIYYHFSFLRIKTKTVVVFGAPCPSAITTMVLRFSCLVWLGFLMITLPTSSFKSR